MEEKDNYIDVCQNGISIEELLKQNRRLSEENERLSEQCKNLLTGTMELQNELNLTQKNLNEKTREFDIISNAFFWKISKPIRDILDKTKTDVTHMKTSLTRDKISKPQESVVTVTSCETGMTSVSILTPKQTMYVAELLKNSLIRLGTAVSILTEEPDSYHNGLYFVICPQIYQKLPDKYIAFQMEQTVSSRWLSTEYLTVLQNAQAVLDYSLINISYFRKSPSLGKTFYYLPIDYLPNLWNKKENGDYKDYKYDLVFYGDIYNQRRLSIVEQLKKHFNVHILYDVYGDELYSQLSRAKVVVNLHYYKNAMLETTRLYETLSVGGSVIVSERSSDPAEEERLEGIVDFVPVGDISALIARIDWWLTHEPERRERIEQNKKILSERSNAFDYYFYRFMLAHDWLSFDRFYQLAGDFVELQSDRICLSLPEETERREAFDRDNHFGFYVIPGLRHREGWVGCGLSYKFIFRKAIEQKFEKVLICEDDVFFPTDFEERFKICLDYLSGQKDWNVFQGLMSNLGDVTLRKVEKKDGQTFVYLDHMISTVFNMYDRSVFESIVQWDETNRDVQINTIDRSLESKDLKIITTSPFLVGHKEDLRSSVWDFQNSEYNDWIMASSEKLENLVQSFDGNMQK